MRFNMTQKTSWETASISVKIAHGLRVKNGGIAQYPEEFKSGFGITVITGKTYEQKEAIKKEGFSFDGTSKVWYKEGAFNGAFENCEVFMV